MNNLKASHIMMHPVVSAERKASLKHTGHQLLAGPYSGMPVLDEQGQIVGMITELDLFKAVAEGKDLTKTIVDAVMSKNVVTAEVDTPVSALIKLMADNNVRRIPITDQGSLAGVVSRIDVLRSLFAPEFETYWTDWEQDTTTP